MAAADSPWRDPRVVALVSAGTLTIQGVRVARDPALGIRSLRGPVIGVLAVTVFVAGSQMSTVASTVPASFVPPQSRTRPSFSSVAVCVVRPLLITSASKVNE